MTLLHLLLVAGATVAALLLPYVAVLPSPVAALRRLARKEAVGPGGPAASVAPAGALACNAAAALLVPTLLPALPEPFGNALAVFALLAAGRLATALADTDRGTAPAGIAVARTTLFLVAAGPAAVLVAFAAGSASLPAALATLRDTGGPVLPPVLAALAVLVLAWTDAGVTGPLPDDAGPVALLARLSAALRRTAWVDLAAVLLPPVPPDGAGTPALAVAALVWAAKAMLLAAALEFAVRRLPTPRPMAAPALAGLLGLLGALLGALRSAAA